MGLSDLAFNALKHLVNMTPSALALPKAQLAARIGFSEGQLTRALTELSISGAVERVKGAIGTPSVLKIMPCSAVLEAKLSMMQQTAPAPDHGSIHGLLPEERLPAAALLVGGDLSHDRSPQANSATHESTHDRSSAEADNNSSFIGRIESGLKIPLKPLKAKTPTVDPGVSSSPLRSDSSKLSCAERFKAEPGEARRKLPDAGEVTPHQTRVHATRATFTQADLDLLVASKRRPTWKPWWDAAVTGTAERLKEQWMARRSVVMGGSGSARLALVDERSSDASKVDSRWRKAATSILETGVTVEHFLAAAEDTKPKAMRFPPLPFIASDAFKLMVQEWVPKDRRPEALIDGEEPEAVNKRYQELLAKARDGVTPSMMVRALPLKGNWPGLWGREDNTRHDRWVGIDMGGSLTRQEDENV